MNKTKIVIVGGGFGGIYTAKNLEKFFDCETAEITLINPSNYFLFTPLLHEVATGGLSPESIVEPIREVFRGDCIKFVEDTVVEIKSGTKEVITSRVTYSYDYLVISAGAETNYFGTPGAKENAFALKNLSDAIALRNHIITTCEKAVLEKNKSLLSFAIVGAGATGVELAAELIEYVQHTICSYHRDSGFGEEDIKVTLITATPDVISQFPIKMRDIALKELNARGIVVTANSIVAKVDPHAITFKDGQILNAHTLIWVAGVTPSLASIKGVDVGPKKRIEVNESLQSLKNPEIFALGDASGAFPMLAQVAVRQAKVVANNISALVAGKKLLNFSFDQKILLISLGQWYAAGHFWKITLRGPVMWWIWRTVYLFNFLSWRKKIEIVAEWTINLFYPRDITLIK
ncbi:MAG: NAD(P)/FAD-dependent oxidoreductase [Patescibacteria group bacterium]